MLAASGVGARIGADLVPLSPALLEVAGEEAARGLALSAGDDYELLFTVAPDRTSRLDALKAGEAITKIGEVEKRPGLRLTGRGGGTGTAPAGYRHFS